MEILEKSGDIKTESKLLDLGCHQGQFLRIMQNLFSMDCYGMDDWPENLKNDESWTYYQHDLANRIELYKKFDYISAMEVIEHMIDTDSFLENCYNLLNDSWKLLLTTPNINSLRNRLYVPLGIYPWALEYRNIIHHVRLYNVSSLKFHLKEKGFKVMHVSGETFFPHKFLKFGFIRQISEKLADTFPQLCSNIVVLAEKQDYLDN